MISSLSPPSPPSPLLPTYARAPLAFDHGEGAWLTATDGERYLDFGGGIAVASLGYSHPHLVAALAEQGRKLWHTSNLFQIPQAERLAARLCEASFADFVFFANSGAEALEGAIKTARKYHAASGHPEKFRIISFHGAFHGRTLATIAAGGNPKYLDGFGPPLEGFDHVAFGDLDAVRAAIGPQTAAILVEPIQGEAGIRVGSPQFLRGLRELCGQYGLLLVLDEVQTGVGRTGKLFAYQLCDAPPDIMAIAKGLGGGFPIGAFLTTREAGKGMGVGTHGTTFGGNPLAAAVGGAVLDVVLAPGFLDRVAAAGARLRAGLLALQAAHSSVIAGIRASGLMLGVELRPPVAEFVAAARKAKVLLIPAGDNVARALPPLIISDADIDEGLRRLQRACASFEDAGLKEAAG